MPLFTNSYITDAPQPSNIKYLSPWHRFSLITLLSLTILVYMGILLGLIVSLANSIDSLLILTKGAW